MAMKFTFSFLNLGKIQIFIPKSKEGGGSTGLGMIPKKKQFFLVLPLFNYSMSIMSSLPPSNFPDFSS